MSTTNRFNRYFHKSEATGDRSHFGALFGTSLHGVTIHTPRSLAEVLQL